MLVGAAGLVARYPGLTRFETGRPLRAGENQLAAGVSLTAVGDHAAREDEASQALSDVPIIAPQPELSPRYGVTDTFDVGFRMSFGTLGVTSSVGLLDSGAVVFGEDILETGPSWFERTAPVVVLLGDAAPVSLVQPHDGA